MVLYRLEKMNDYMKKTGIFYGSTTGTTKDVAFRLAEIFGVAREDVHDVASSAPHMLGEYETLLLGSSTWGSGELQDDWYDFLDGASALDLKGHRAAVFRCGDETMTDTFCNAVGIIYHKMKGTGAEMRGHFPAEGYTFEASEARLDGSMAGLVLDEVNHPELTDRRLREWASSLG